MSRVSVHSVLDEIDQALVDETNRQLAARPDLTEPQKNDLRFLAAVHVGHSIDEIEGVIRNELKSLIESGKIDVPQSMVEFAEAIRPLLSRRKAEKSDKAEIGGLKSHKGKTTKSFFSLLRAILMGR